MARNKVCLVALIAILASGPVFAQPAAGTTGQTPRSPNTPLDFGPFTPEANRAFQGGGMILQGAPGEPAPRPEPTPPGQTPRNMVPPR
jgi:hypothetical protein